MEILVEYIIWVDSAILLSSAAEPGSGRRGICCRIENSKQTTSSACPVQLQLQFFSPVFLAPRKKGPETYCLSRFCQAVAVKLQFPILPQILLFVIGMMNRYGDWLVTREYPEYAATRGGNGGMNTVQDKEPWGKGGRGTFHSGCSWFHHASSTFHISKEFPLA